MTDEIPPQLAWTETDPQHAAIDALAAELETADAAADQSGEWSEALWSRLEQSAAPRWQVPADFGGMASSRPLVIQRYAQLAGGSLTAVFVLSQHDAAVRRLISAEYPEHASQWLHSIGAGDTLGTVGISHLTTSKRLGTGAIRVAERGGGGYVLDGAMPWVTAATRADLFVTGAALDDGRQLLIALPADLPGVTVDPPFALAALQASCTCQVKLDRVEIDNDHILSGPSPEIFAHPGAVGTAGLETSALALGQARAALLAIGALADNLGHLAEPLDVLCDHWRTLWNATIDLANGRRAARSSDELRAQANALVLNSTQAYLTARKGTGFLRTEPAQRWARQALFFLVWSCPPPVAQAAIRDLAGLCQL
jgi:alkylation response protein AidB-like acyl-CoA dehydrogenase